jgi:hypothetical protein
MDDISTDELKAAYHEAELWRRGISYQHAIESPLLLRCLRNQVRAHRKAQANRRPVQAALQLEAA